MSEPFSVPDLIKMTQLASDNLREAHEQAERLAVHLRRNGMVNEDALAKAAARATIGAATLQSIVESFEDDEG